jgi:hypothetical protein
VTGLHGTLRWLRGRTGASRALLLTCRHVLWIALFTLPSVVLWWHVWTGHPSAMLTCPCGDPAQEVWFMAWPAWAIGHLANIFFSGSVNVPYGANLLSNTSGPLVGVVLSPVTWLWGPVVATNVALTLAPGLSAWACFVALRPLVTWRAGAVPAAIVYGYSAAIVSSLAFGHVSVSVLFVPPLLLTTLHEILVRQAHGPLRDGLTLAALAVVQFLISPEMLVICLLLAVIGVVATAAAGWRSVRTRAVHAVRALGIGTGISAACLAYPAWFGLAGPQSVSGVLFALAPLSGVLVSGYFSPGRYGMRADIYFRFGGYEGRMGPPPNFIGWGIGAGALASVLCAWRRPLMRLLLFMALVAALLSLGSYLLGGTLVYSHVWLPWRTLSRLPVLKEILPTQMAPFAALFLAFILALGLDAVAQWLRQHATWPARRATILALVTTGVVGVAALVPVFMTFDMPFTVQSTAIPRWMAHQAPRLPGHPVLLTVPFAVSGSTAPMLWQAVDDMHFRLAGAGLKTPDAHGGPVDQGQPGSARRVLTNLTITGVGEPSGTRAQLSAVRRAVRAWKVNEVVVDGPSRDPTYASGFLTAALGKAPSYVQHAWVWKIPAGGPSNPPVVGAPLQQCRASSAGPVAGREALHMAECVLARSDSP